MGYLSEEEKIEEEFSELIRDKMGDNEFWEYVRSWKDVLDLCEEMEEWWDTDTKRRAIEEIKLIMGKKKKKYKVDMTDMPKVVWANSLQEAIKIAQDCFSYWNITLDNKEEMF